jgi:hypothetical protein
LFDAGRGLAAGASEQWINRPGDANRDSVFDTRDLVAVFAGGEYDDPQPGNSTWSDGDWNSDGDFTSGDVVAAFQSGGFEIGPNPLRGDFDRNGTVNVADIDALFAQLRVPNPDTAFDLTGDGRVDDQDRDELIDNILGTTFGDANLDSVFNSSDLVSVFQVAEYEDSPIGNSTWSEGDWDGDGEFATSDLVIAFQRGGFAANAR